MGGTQPHCYVLMPDAGGRRDAPDFGAVYEHGIRPAVVEAGMTPVRSHGTAPGDTLDRPAFERLLLADFAIVDLTLAPPDLLYALGVRHAVQPNVTLAIHAAHAPLPVDATLIPAVPYQAITSGEHGEGAASLREAVSARLRALRQPAYSATADTDDLFHLVGGNQQGNATPASARRRLRETDGALYDLLNRYGGHEKTDVFRGVVAYSSRSRRALADARRLPADHAIAELRRIHQEMRPLDRCEAGALIDLLLSYRAVGAYDEMIALHDEMPGILARTVLAREQLAFALNRRASRTPPRPEYRARAIAILEEIIGERGPSPETGGLLGRVYKDLWQEALAAGRGAEALPHLRHAIEAYTDGFRADPRDAYPGVNAVTLLDIEGGARSVALRDELLPVVRFAVRSRLAGTTPDYWDYAALLELAVLAGDEHGAGELAARALSRVRESWEPETTARNLTYLYDARRARGEAPVWLRSTIDVFAAHARARRTPAE